MYIGVIVVAGQLPGTALLPIGVIDLNPLVDLVPTALVFVFSKFCLVAGH